MRPSSSWPVMLLLRKPRVDQQQIHPGRSHQAAVSFGGTQLEPARDIGLARRQRLEAEHRRAVLADHQTQRLVELGATTIVRPV